MIPIFVSTYSTRDNNILFYKVKNIFYQNSFFSTAVIEWNKEDPNICN